MGGVVEGSTFTVEFAYDNNNNNLPPPTAAEAVPVSAPAVAVAAQRPPPRQTDNNYDDGFASGFGSNPNYNNPDNYARATPAATNGNYSSYPTATDAQVVQHFDAPPQQVSTSRYTPNYTPTYTPYVTN